MKRRRQRSRLLLRTDETVSSLDCTILLGVIAAGVGGAPIAFSDSTETALINIGEVKNVKLAALKLN